MGCAASVMEQCKEASTVITYGKAKVFTVADTGVQDVQPEHVPMDKLSEEIQDIHHTLPKKLQEKNVRFVNVEALLKWDNIRVYEEVSEDQTCFTSIPYKDIKEEMWAAALALSWRWHAQKIKDRKEGWSPMSKSQFEALKTLVRHMAENESISLKYVWIDWCCVPQYSDDPMDEIVRSRLYYARSRVFCILPTFTDENSITRFLHAILMRVARRLATDGVKYSNCLVNDQTCEKFTADLLDRLLQKGTLCGHEYFGRVWTLAERLSRCSWQEGLRKWIPLDVWMAMVVNALSKAPENPDGAKLYWSKLFGTRQRRKRLDQAIKALGEGMRAGESAMAADSVGEALGKVLVDAVQVWFEGQLEEAPTKAWLKDYLETEVLSVYEGFNSLDGIFSVYGYYCFQETSYDRWLEALIALATIVDNRGSAIHLLVKMLQVPEEMAKVWRKPTHVEAAVGHMCSLTHLNTHAGDKEKDRKERVELVGKEGAIPSLLTLLKMKVGEIVEPSKEDNLKADNDPVESFVTMNTKESAATILYDLVVAKKTIGQYPWKQQIVDGIPAAGSTAKAESGISILVGLLDPAAGSSDALKEQLVAIIPQLPNFVTPLVEAGGVPLLVRMLPNYERESAVSKGVIDLLSTIINTLPTTNPARRTLADELVQLLLHGNIQAKESAIVIFKQMEDVVSVVADAGGIPPLADILGKYDKSLFVHVGAQEILQKMAAGLSAEGSHRVHLVELLVEHLKSDNHRAREAVMPIFCCLPNCLNTLHKVGGIPLLVGQLQDFKRDTPVFVATLQIIAHMLSTSANVVDAEEATAALVKALTEMFKCGKTMQAREAAVTALFYLPDRRMLVQNFLTDKDCLPAIMNLLQDDEILSRMDTTNWAVWVFQLLGQLAELTPQGTATQYGGRAKEVVEAGGAVAVVQALDRHHGCEVLRQQLFVAAKHLARDKKGGGIPVMIKAGIIPLLKELSFEDQCQGDSGWFSTKGEYRAKSFFQTLELLTELSKPDYRLEYTPELPYTSTQEAIKHSGIVQVVHANLMATHHHMNARKFKRVDTGKRDAENDPIYKTVPYDYYHPDYENLEKATHRFQWALGVPESKRKKCDEKTEDFTQADVAHKIERELEEDREKAEEARKAAEEKEAAQREVERIRNEKIEAKEHQRKQKAEFEEQKRLARQEAELKAIKEGKPVPSSSDWSADSMKESVVASVGDTKDYITSSLGGMFSKK